VLYRYFKHGELTEQEINCMPDLINLRIFSNVSMVELDSDEARMRQHFATHRVGSVTVCWLPLQVVYFTGRAIAKEVRVVLVMSLLIPQMHHLDFLQKLQLQLLDSWLCAGHP
jgi:hypothetical protein